MRFVSARRTFYQLGNDSTIPGSKIQDLVKQTIRHTPSSFNAQSTRIVVLLHNEHRKLWEATKASLKAIIPADKFPATEQRINGFAGAYGTILFFEDSAVIQSFAEKIPLYADKFPQWSEHTSAMHQYVLWTALEAEGLGCNLQHYNPVIDAKVASEWKIPAAWQLKAQLVFGKPTGRPAEKVFQSVEDRLKFFG